MHISWENCALQKLLQRIRLEVPSFSLALCYVHLMQPPQKSACPVWLQVWLVEDGTVERYDGDFDDYKTELIKEIAAEMDEDEEEEARSRPNKP